MATTTSLRSVTAVVDPQVKGHPALDKAAALATRSGARLTLLNTFVLPQPMADVARVSARAVVTAALRERHRQLEKVAGRLRGRGLKVTCVVEWDYPQHEAVVRHVLKTRPDVLVAETTHHSRLARWILSNTDWELIRSCPCPLWLVRAGKLPRKPEVLVAVDPAHEQARRSRLDTRLMDAAGLLVANLGGRIGIVHADDPHDSSLEAVEHLATRYGVAPARRYVFPGETNRVVPAVVEGTGTDILVLGAVSRSRLGQPVIGTTAERLIDRVECDVFVVKPVGYQSPVSRRRPRIPA